MSNEREKLYEALDTITKNFSNPALEWAIGYTEYAKTMLTSNSNDEDLKTQILYVLNNISHWRHPEAKAVRGTLKAFVKTH